jgi:hypothetical protein
MVAPTCDPNYLGGRSGGSWFEASLGKKLARSISTSKLTMVASIFHTHCIGGINSRTTGPGQLGQKCEILLEKKQKQKRKGHDSSDVSPA